MAGKPKKPERRWDWHMNVLQKAVMWVFADDDVVSTTTLRTRIIDRMPVTYRDEDQDLERWHMRCLKRRGLLEEVTHNVWRLTASGRRASAQARKEITEWR